MSYQQKPQIYTLRALRRLTPDWSFKIPAFWEERTNRPAGLTGVDGTHPRVAVKGRPYLDFLEMYSNFPITHLKKRKTL